MKVKNLLKINDDFYWINSTSGQLWSMMSSQKNEPVLKNRELSKAVHFCSACQMLPSNQKACLTTEGSHNDVIVAFTSSDEIGLEIPALKPRSHDCDILMPPTQFIIKYKLFSEEKFANSRTFVQMFPDSSLKVTVDGLRPFSDYDLEISAFSSLGHFSGGYPATIQASTLEGPPSPPRDIQAVVLTPSSVLVSWLPSEVTNGPRVTYEVHYQTENVIEVKDVQPAKKKLLLPSSPLSLIINGLEASREYKIWVVAKTQSTNVTSSASIKVRTFEAPNLVVVTGSTPRSVALSWLAPEEDLIRSHQVVLESRNKTMFRAPDDPELTQIKQKYHYQINGLQPGEKYVIRIVVSYKSSISGEEFQWPIDERLSVSAHSGLFYLLPAHFKAKMTMFQVETSQISCKNG